MVKNTENSVSDNISSRKLLRLFNEFQINGHRRLPLNNLMKLESRRGKQSRTERPSVITGGLKIKIKN